MATKKNVALEAVRGVAALVVVVYHICLGFFPYYAGVFPEYARQSWQGEPFFVFVNGNAAVALFFVLSGYVLSRRFFELGDHRILLKGAVKRWPRLMGPVLLVVLASYALFKFNLYQFEQAGAASGSPWLINFAHVDAYDNKPPIQLEYALREGAFLTFFRGDSYFDSAIWTMRPELIGSFITFGLAPILFEARKSSFLLTIGLIAFATVLIRNANSNLLGFPIGVGLAALIPRGLAIPRGFGYAALLTALYLLGYSGAPTGIYALLPFLTTHTNGTNVIGAALLIAVIETLPSIREIFSGRISQFLGALSFPIYLVHILIICSAGSAIYLRAGALPAAFVVFIGSILVSLPLMAFNNWWITRVNAATDLTTRLAT
jgi:peptidoglycan/LPS O-acetylase OafA/YrhL